MKKFFTCVFFVFAFVFCKDDKAEIFVDGIAAIVGEHVVLKSDVAQLVNVAAVQQRLNPSTDINRLLLLQQEIIRSIVDQKIMLEMAAVDSIEVADKDVDRALDQQIEMFVSQAGSEEKAEEMLGQSLKSFRREFWYEMKDRLTSEKYQQGLISKININRSDVEQFFTTYKDSLPLFPTMVKIRHLLVPVLAGSDSRGSTYKKLAEIRQKIIAGESFGEKATLYSQDPGSQPNGGSLGYVRRGALVQEFEAVAFSQDIGVISDIVETPFGYHIIETEEKLGDKIKVRHILLIPEITEEDESLSYKTALSLKDSIVTQADFKRLVAIHSSDVKTKEIGGNLGWINPQNSQIPELSQVINLLDVGACSLPVRTTQGYHLFWIDTFRPGGKPDLIVHWPEIENIALNHKRAKWYENWIAVSRERFFIQINTW